MESTVQPERKLMVGTLARPSTSSTGLMITPPPMPQMAPTTEERKLTTRKRAWSMASPSVDFLATNWIILQRKPSINPEWKSVGPGPARQSLRGAVMSPRFQVPRTEAQGTRSMRNPYPTPSSNSSTGARADTQGIAGIWATRGVAGVARRSFATSVPPRSLHGRESSCRIP